MDTEQFNKLIKTIEDENYRQAFMQFVETIGIILVLVLLKVI